MTASIVISSKKEHQLFTPHTNYVAEILLVPDCDVHCIELKSYKGSVFGKRYLHKLGKICAQSRPFYKKKGCCRDQDIIQ